MGLHFRFGIKHAFGYIYMLAYNVHCSIQKTLGLFFKITLSTIIFNLFQIFL